MANPYYTHGTVPLANSGPSGVSAAIRAEFDAVTAGFNLFPSTLTTGSFLQVNSGGTALQMTRYIPPTDWIMSFTCATPGDLSTAGGYFLQTSWYAVIGSLVIMNVSMKVLATWTTASGDVYIQTPPFFPPVSGAASYTGPIGVENYKNATYKQLALRLDPSNSRIRLIGYAPTQPVYSVQITDFTSGAATGIYGTILYHTDG